MRHRYTISKPYTTAIIPWAWPYGDEDHVYYRGDHYFYTDPDQEEPWEILAAKEKWERIAARLKKDEKTSKAARR